jgi:phosphate-selective porin
MKKMILTTTLAILSLTSAFANDGDLTMPGERWDSKFTAFVCGDGNTPAQVAPSDFTAYNVQLGHMTTDFSLDNYLLKATFVENNIACNYSAIMLADNAAWTIKLVQSKAFSVNGESDCVNGKAILDSALADNKYAYLHGRAAIWAPVTGAEASCGVGASSVGLHFQVVGKL